MVNVDYKKLSSTAAPVVYGRTFSDIPYNKEIAELCRVDSLISDAYRKTNRLIAPYIEARFKALTHLFATSGIKNILELASGLSQRGLIMAKDKTLTYIDTDLLEMIQQKEEVLKELLNQKNKLLPSNLQFVALNALDEKALKSVITRFPQGPIAIGHEGFLAHLTRDERTKLAQIIKTVLLDRGGVWITPDVFTGKQLADLLAHGEGQEVTADVEKTTGRNYYDNAFIDIEEAKSFFGDLGFHYEIHTLGETAGDIASVKIGLDEDSVKSQLALNIWELRPLKN